MSKMKKRPYRSLTRNAQAAHTKGRILIAAKNLFESEGFEYVTIEKIAQGANVSIPTIYALFQSKLGVLRTLMDDALPQNQFEALVEESIIEKSPLRWRKIHRENRKRNFDRFPYAIIYSAANSVITVIAVMHLHRRPFYWKARYNK